MRRIYLLVPLLLVGCVSVKLKSEAPVITAYKLDYPTPAQEGSPTGSIVRIRGFAAAKDLDRVDLVLITESGIVKRAASHRWAVRPADALAELLYRDLLATGGFDGVFKGSAAVAEQATILGFVREFGGRQQNGEWRAMLDIDMTIMDSHGNIMLQKTYRLNRALGGTGYDMLAAQLRILTQEWSAAARGDIRAALSPDGE